MNDELQACVQFLQRLIQTPAIPGEESKIARCVKEEMERLAYDSVWIDEAGNVIGQIEGEGRAPDVMFATHLDHVDIGPLGDWEIPPYEGQVRKGKVWGRGAVDIKGPLAAQVYGVARLKRQGMRPPGHVYVVATVQEEIGGVGARYLMQHLRPPLVVVGEPSRNELRQGHRGRILYEVIIQGRSAHASMPEQGINPLDTLGQFLLERFQFEAQENPKLGRTTVVPTLVRVDQTSSNVIPAKVWLALDCRNVPEQSRQDIFTQLNEILQRSLRGGASARLHIPVVEQRTYTGYTLRMAADNPPFLLPDEHPFLQAAQEVLRQRLNRRVPVGVWNFATDGGHFARAGLKVLGIGPGDDTLAHTANEHIDIAAIEEALHINEALAMQVGIHYETLRRRKAV